MPLAMMMIYRTFISHICAFSLQIFLLPVPTHPGTQIFLQVQNPSHPEVKNPCPTGPAHEYHNKKKNMRTSPLPIKILELILHNIAICPFHRQSKHNLIFVAISHFFSVPSKSKTLKYFSKGILTFYP